MRCVVFSDDLTGAHNIGVEFAGYGFKTVAFERVPDQTDADVLIINTNSRYMPRDAAYNAVHGAAVALFATGAAPDVLVKKIDSLLRGNIGAEIDAVLDATGLDRSLVAMASPRLNRTTIGGYQLYNGVPITKMNRLDPISTVESAHVPQNIQSQSKRAVHHVPLNSYNNSYKRPGHYVADAATTQHLNDVVVKAYKGGVRCFAGTYGLGNALCRVLSKTVAPVLVVVGSLSGVSQGQARALAQRTDCAYLPFSPQADSWKALGDALGLAASLGENPVVHITGALNVSDSLYAKLQETFEPVMGQFGGFIGTGGTTAQLILNLLDAEGVAIAPVELFPGTPAARLIGGAHDGKPFLAKPGAQGDENSLDIMLQVAQSMQRIHE